MTLLSIPCERVTLIIPAPDHAELVAEYLTRNRAYLEPWVPERDDAFYELAAVRKRLEEAEVAFQQGTRYAFAIIENRTGRVIGLCGFSNIVRGVFLACHLGFSGSEQLQGKGLMFEALRAAITYMFEVVGLHRIMANHLPHNERSAKLLKRLGFEREGYAKSYLKIAGQWQDHVLNSLVNGE